MREEKATQKRKHEEEESQRAAQREEKRRRLAEESRRQRAEEDAVSEARRRVRLGLPPLIVKKQEGEDEDEGADQDTTPHAILDDDQLKAKLRTLHEPAILFGESHAARQRRYRALTTPKPVLSSGPIPTTIVLLPEAEMRVPAKVPLEPGPERELLYRQLASYFTLVLAEWARVLEARPREVRESFQGRQAAGAMEQSRENMRPLFRLLEAGALEKGVLEPVVGIVRAAQERRYVDANDGYLRLSIGKA